MMSQTSASGSKGEWLLRLNKERDAATLHCGAPILRLCNSNTFSTAARFRKRTKRAKSGFGKGLR